MDESPKLRPILLVLAAMFAFSLMVVFTRGAQANILGVAAWRAIIVAVVFAISTVLREGGVPALKPDGVTLRLGLWLGLALAVASSTFVGGYAFTTVANTIFLHNLAPVMVFPLAYWLFKERSGAAAVTGAGIALFGVAMLSGVSLFQVSHFASSRFLLGDFLAFVSAIGYAAVLVLTRMTRRENTPILATLTVAWVFAAVLLSVVAVAAGGFSISGSAMLWVVGLAVISTNIPFYLLNLGMKAVPAGMAAVLSLSEVLFATAIGILVYGERLAPIGWIGAALAGLGVLYAITQDSEEAVEQDLSLPTEVHTPRLLRAGLGLVLLNIGAVSSIKTEWPGAPMVTLLGLTMLARFGPGAASALLDGRFAGTLRWIGAGLGAMVLSLAYQSAGTHEAIASLGLGLALLAVAFIDGKLASQEPEALRDDAAVIRAATVLLGLALVLAWTGHSWGVALVEGSNLLLAIGGLVVLSAALRDTGLSARPGVPAVDDRVSAWTRGRRGVTTLVIIWALGALHVVPTGHVGIVERFGEPVSRTDGAGLSLRLPPPIETMTVVDVGAERQLDLAAQTLLTGDQSMVSLEAVLHYKVSDVDAFAYGSHAPVETLKTLAEAALLEGVARSNQDVLLTTGRFDTEGRVLRALQAAVDEANIGFSVSAVHLTKVAVPPPVVASFLDVITADEERQTDINLAEAYAADVVPRARGEALARIIGAQGDASQIEAEAIGYDVWFRSLHRNSKRQMELTRARLKAETAEDNLSPARLIVAPSSVRVWLDDGAWPRDPETEEGR